MATKEEREIGLAAIAAIKEELAKLPHRPNPFTPTENSDEREPVDASV